MTITTEQLDELERKARAAPRLTWYVAGEYPLEHCEIRKAVHIAANSPAVTLSLIARIRDLELRLEIATELNVGDRKRIDELEAGLREAIDFVDPDRSPEVIDRFRKLLG